MNIRYYNTDVAYELDDDFEIKRKIHSGNFIQSMYTSLLPDREGCCSEEIKDGIVLDYDKDGNVLGIEIYLMDMIMDKEALEEFDKGVPDGFRARPESE